MVLSHRKPKRVKYPNQPLIEVATEVRFPGDLSVEAKRADFQQRVRLKYPNLTVAGAVQGVAPPLQHYRFERDDRAAAVALAVNSIAYFERQYSGATTFIKEAVRLVNLGSRLFGLDGLTRIGWRYINAIPFVREGNLIPLDRFLKNSPTLLSIDVCEFKNITFRAVTEYEGSQVAIRLENDTSSQPNEILFLDIDVYKEDPTASVLKVNKVKQLVDELHCIARNVFEDSITDQYRKYLQGEAYA